MDLSRILRCLPFSDERGVCWLCRGRRRAGSEPLTELDHHICTRPKCAQIKAFVCGLYRSKCEHVTERKSHGNSEDCALLSRHWQEMAELPADIPLVKRNSSRLAKIAEANENEAPIVLSAMKPSKGGVRRVLKKKKTEYMPHFVTGHDSNYD